MFKMIPGIKSVAEHFLNRPLRSLSSSFAYALQYVPYQLYNYWKKDCPPPPRKILYDGLNLLLYFPILGKEPYGEATPHSLQKMLDTGGRLKVQLLIRSLDKWRATLGYNDVFLVHRGTVQLMVVYSLDFLIRRGTV